jgi:tetratricopeptide (TPR) repeat protein
MSPVTSLTKMSEQQLNRWIKRIALLFLVVLIAFVAFYVFDRYNPIPQAPIAERQLASLEEAVRAKPDDISSRGQLADMYSSLGRYADAVAQYDMIVNSGKAQVPGHLGRGEAYRLSGQYEAALPDYQAVIDALKDTDQAVVDRSLQTAYYGLGSSLMSLGRASEATAPLQNAVALNSTDADTQYLYATALLKAGDADGALAALRRSVEFVPVGWADPYLAMADAFKLKGDAAHVEWALAMADLANGKGDQAETRLTALADGDAALDAAIGLGLVNEMKGNALTAADWYRKALVIDPSNESATLGYKRVAAPASGNPVASPAPTSDAPTSPDNQSGMRPQGDRS